MGGRTRIGIQTGRPASGLPAPLLRVLALLAWLAVLWALVFVLAPMLGRLEPVRPLALYIEESGVDATGLFYTEVKETGDAENYLRNTFRYRPSPPEEQGQ